MSDNDWKVSQNVLSRLGQKLPGNSEADIARWVELRKRNWPSRANVQRKTEEMERKRRAGQLMHGDKRRRAWQSMHDDKSRCAGQSTHDDKKEEHEGRVAANGGDALHQLADHYGESSCEEGEVVEKSTGKKPRDNKRQNDKRKKWRAGRKSRNSRVKQGGGGVAQRPQLLKKLLSKEIEREQSLLLQAFRHLLMSDNEGADDGSETRGIKLEATD